MKKLLVYTGTHYGCVHHILETRADGRAFLVRPIAAPGSTPFWVHISDTSALSSMPNEKCTMLNAQ